MRSFGHRSRTAQVDAQELARRKAARRSPQPKFARGYGVLYLNHIRQADTGCDFRFPRD